MTRSRLDEQPNIGRVPAAEMEQALLAHGLPSELAAERAILGAVLLNNQLAEEASSIPIEHFSLDSNRCILRSALNLYRQDLPIDEITLPADLKASGELEKIGGFTYIASLIDGVPRIDTIKYYARILSRNFLKRQIINAGSQAAAEATEADADPEDIANRLVTLISNVVMSAPGASKGSPVCLADVQPEAVRWLWEPRIPLRKVTLIEGDPGLGKSYATCAIGTGVAAGYGLPGAPRTEPRNVLMLSAEDGLADTIRPRLDAMGADVSRIFAITEPVELNMLSGRTRLERALAEHRPALVIIDPLVAYLGAGTDMHRANETRSIMAWLARLAEKYGCAILAVRHLRKSGSDRAIYRGVGSIDFTAACRSVLLVGADPDDPSKRAIAHIKSNLAAMADSIGYEIRGGQFYWTGKSELTADRMLAAGAVNEDHSAVDRAESFLRAELRDGQQPARELQRRAKSEGISEATLRRARARLGVKSEPVGAQGRRGVAGWSWELPAEGEKDLAAHTNSREHLNQRDPNQMTETACTQDVTAPDLVAQDLVAQGGLSALIKPQASKPMPLNGTRDGGKVVERSL